MPGRWAGWGRTGDPGPRVCGVWASTACTSRGCETSVSDAAYQRGPSRAAPPEPDPLLVKRERRLDDLVHRSNAAAVDHAVSRGRSETDVEARLDAVVSPDDGSVDWAVHPLLDDTAEFGLDAVLEVDAGQLSVEALEA